MSPISVVWNARRPRSFHQSCGPNAQIWIQWTTKFVQKCSSGSASEKFITCIDWHYDTVDGWRGFELHVINNAMDELCKRLRVCLHVKGRLSEYSIWLQIIHMYILMCYFRENFKSPDVIALKFKLYFNIFDVVHFTRCSNLSKLWWETSQNI